MIPQMDALQRLVIQMELSSNLVYEVEPLLTFEPSYHPIWAIKDLLTCRYQQYRWRALQLLKMAALPQHLLILNYFLTNLIGDNNHTYQIKLHLVSQLVHHCV